MLHWFLRRSVSAKFYVFANGQRIGIVTIFGREVFCTLEKIDDPQGFGEQTLELHWDFTEEDDWP